MTPIKNRGRPSWDFVRPSSQSSSALPPPRPPPPPRYATKWPLIPPHLGPPHLGPQGAHGSPCGIHWVRIQGAIKFGRQVFHPERPPRLRKSTFSGFVAHFRPENRQVFSVQTAPIGCTKGRKRRKIGPFLTKPHFVKLQRKIEISRLFQFQIFFWVPIVSPRLLP